MKWGNQGMPKDLDLLNNLRVIFTVCCLVFDVFTTQYQLLLEDCAFTAHGWACWYLD